jgi:hypothetical protein
MCDRRTDMYLSKISNIKHVTGRQKDPQPTIYPTTEIYGCQLWVPPVPIPEEIQLLMDGTNV